MGSGGKWDSLGSELHAAGSGWALALGAGFSPLELRRLLLSGEVVAPLSGAGSGWDAGAGRMAFPLRMSMT